MSLRVVVATCLFFVVALAGCSSPTGESNAKDAAGSLLDAPADPAVGTIWEYEVDGAASGDSVSELKAHETKNGHSAAYVQHVIQTSSGTITADSWQRRSDSAIIEVTVDAPQIGETTVTFDPPCLQIKYPVSAGDSYDVTCTGSTDTQYGAFPVNQQTHVDVVGLATIDTAAGSQSTIHIQITSGDTTTDNYFALDGCGLVKGEQFNAQVTLVSTTC